MRERVAALVQVDNEDDHRRLERLLGSPRLAIDPTFTLTKDQTLNALASGRFDVVAVAGEAVETLESVVDTYPHIARVELRLGSATGPSLAHQVVNTPWDIAKMEAALVAAVYLGDGISTGDLIELIRAAKQVPAVPDTYIRLQSELASPDASLEKAAEIISTDAGVALRILQYVNSAAVGVRQQVVDIRHAATLLGLRKISSLVLAAGVFDQANGLDRRFVSALWDESMQVSQLAYQIAREENCDSEVIDGIGLAGLLHDIGDLVLFQNWRDLFNRVDPADRIQGEIDVFGTTHADVGAYLAALWGLRRDVVDGIRFHHDPKLLGQESLDIASVLHVARGLVDANLDVSRADIDTDLLDRLGYSQDSPDRWAAFVA